MTTNVDDLEVDGITAPPIEASKLVDGQPVDRHWVRLPAGVVGISAHIRCCRWTLWAVSCSSRQAPSITSPWICLPASSSARNSSVNRAHGGNIYITTVFVTIPLGVTLAIQLSVIAGQIGAISLADAATGMFTIRQGASLVSALLLAAAVGLAVSADLGARIVREEIDAMNVMGVASIRRLVVPHFAAVILIGLALTGWACFVGLLAGYILNVYMQNGTPGSRRRIDRQLRGRRSGCTGQRLWPARR